MGDEGHADHVARERAGLFVGPGQLDAAALSAAARVDLRLDDHDAAAQTAGDVAGFGGVERDLAARHGHAVARENGFGLVLVDFHRLVSKLLMLAAFAEGRQPYRGRPPLSSGRPLWLLRPCFALLFAATVN